jgi:hypothetical protein
MPEPRLRKLALSTKGFMPADEGDALYRAGLRAAQTLPGAPWVEVGSYCGRSTVWLGAAAQRSGVTLFAVDHHRGSEENQEGWQWHDADLVDQRTGKMDTLGFFRSTIHDAELEEVVVAVVGPSAVIGRLWGTPLGLLFIDGGHGVEPARADYLAWTPQIAMGGLLVIHDVFPDPADGGRPPYEEIFRPALESGRFGLLEAVGSLRILQRLDGG